jgi:hypothetical protein
MIKRKILDCRDFPNEIGCTLLISGSPKEVFNIALRHSLEEHGHKDTYELRKQLRVMMKPEAGGIQTYKVKNNINNKKQKGSSK